MQQTCDNATGMQCILLSVVPSEKLYHPRVVSTWIQCIAYTNRICGTTAEVGTKVSFQTLNSKSYMNSDVWGRSECRLCASSLFLAHCVGFVNHT